MEGKGSKKKKREKREYDYWEDPDDEVEAMGLLSFNLSTGADVERIMGQQHGSIKTLRVF